MARRSGGSPTSSKRTTARSAYAFDLASPVDAERLLAIGFELSGWVELDCTAKRVSSRLRQIGAARVVPFRDRDRHVSPPATAETGGIENARAAHPLHSSSLSMTRRGLSLRVLLLVTVASACQPPEAEQAADLSGNDDGIVVHAEGDGSEFEWSGALQIPAAEIGEWMLFVSPHRPTNLAELPTFDPNRDCTTATIDCELPGVGYYAASAKVTERGKPLRMGAGGLGRTEAQYWVLARRGGAPPAFVAVHVDVGVAGGGGCFGMPDPPTLRALEVPRR